jgi:hypothetical protein
MLAGEAAAIGLRRVLLGRAVVVAAERVAAAAAVIAGDAGVIAVVRDAVAVAIRQRQAEAQRAEVLECVVAELVLTSEARDLAVRIEG